MNHKLTRLAGAGMLACLLSTGLGTTSRAQNIIPPSFAQQGLAPTPNHMATINAAMMECPDYGGRTLAAVVTSEINGTNLYLNYGNGAVTSGPIPVTSAGWAWADVTIGDDPVMPGNRYVVVVSYREYFSPGMYNIYLRRFIVEDLAGAMTVTPFAPVMIGLGDNPKIDNVADPANAVGPYPGMTQFLATYTLMTGGTVGYHKANMDFTAPQVGTIPLSSGYISMDAAAVRDLGVNGGDVFAYVSVLGNNNTELRVYEKNVTTGAPATFTTLQTGLMSYYSRIEALGLRDANAGLNDAKWAVTTSSNLRRIMLYTNLTPPYYCNPQAYFNTGSQEYPALASGIGALGGPPANMGNSQYTYAWGAPTMGNYYSQAIATDGTPIAPNDFHVVNNSPCVMPSDPPELIALCNSANSGTDLFVAWNEGSRVMYKQLDNTLAYRPTAVKDAQSFASLTVSPNPAKDKIIIRTTEEVNGVSIVNSVGALVSRKSIKTGETTLDISNLAAGTYFLHISGKNGTTTKSLVVVK